MRWRARLLMPALACGLAIATGAVAAQRANTPRDPETRAVEYLEREVPRWRREHPCYSCHNNGDAARALIAASRRGHRVDAALAARLVARDQKPDGSWRLDTSQSVGSPVTYGTALVTWSALRTTADPAFAAAIARAESWTRDVEVATVLDASAVTLALDRAGDDRASAQRRRCLEILQRGQAPDGGWGPYVTSAAEPFDTAVAMLALTPLSRTPPLASPVYSPADLTRAIDRGRRFLIDRQLDEGGWPETTRPANQESYAQRISTTAWVVLALVER